jgi:NAD(P)-dependent dehydrogenase (short-subunit alcohol dehydrogenase family)
MDGMTSERTVIVTGAAGAIGGATVDGFLAAGLHVLGLDLAPSPAPDRAGYRHAVVDLRDTVAVDAAVDDGLHRLPPLAHVVGIAGGALPGEPAAAAAGDPAAIDVGLFRASIESNLVTQWAVVRSALRHLEAGDGDRSIALTSSFNALSAQGMPAYSAAKAGLHGLMFGLVDPLGRRGIRVNVVAPGTVRTPRTEALWASSPGHFERLEAGTATGRLATPQDVADVFVSLALRLHHVTGQVLVVDGGQLAIHRATTT